MCMYFFILKPGIMLDMWLLPSERNITWQKFARRCEICVGKFSCYYEVSHNRVVYFSG